MYVDRQVSVNVFADRYGGAVYLFDRDCSVQRRHQKIIEEAPAPGLSEEFHSCHISLVAMTHIRTHTRLTPLPFLLSLPEAITGQDLVEWQLRVAAGQALPRNQDQLAVGGHAIEARIYAESPRNNFLPGAGTVRRWRTPAAAVSFSNAPLRVDSGVREVRATRWAPSRPHDRQLVVHGPDRCTALKAMEEALRNTQAGG
ncbi:hypothetical protein VOLCADRAFT_101577 [Volvox carteri f. nagariensis]|uniref:Biotin carboxylation domain-containing protein n=1 Tax=Volvox carteri f. nagariensis TaxID=3068 RepID=D8THM3_VOLCA|nr:uncharacterized protein VOLCADRAFT_101577 [Volvox carteri f. nagariensis]EFJ52737.1 hypothetical protein VOLCADRAFT_101577 [Volvox carteri f. nagariensis]|eukprot:XP_002945742.1 hypothetical protein VOLCADRAFT_101577 [Volvox carteri f. nagariensis]